MKIAVFVTYTYPYVGSGIGNVALTQSEMLVQAGHEVTIVSSNFPKSELSFVRNGVNHIKLPAIRWLEKLHIPVPLYLFNKEVVSQIKNADVVHIHDAVYPSSVLAALIARYYKKRIVLTQHIALIKYPSFIINLIQKIMYATLGALTMSLSEKIIYLNPTVKALINNPKKEVYLPNGVNLTLFRPLISREEKTALRQKYGIAPDKKVFLFVGRLVPKKGFDILFEARNPKYQLLFVGGGVAPKHMTEDPLVTFLPAQKQESLSEIYRLSDGFVLPSTGEGFPLSIQEAMASGLPIITSKENIFDEALDFIKTIDVTADAITTAILSLIDNDNEVAILSKKARETAETLYSWNQNVEQLLKIYTGKQL